MAIPAKQPDKSIGVPSVDELRALGRTRLLNYFLLTNVKPPEDLDELAHAARELLLQEAAQNSILWAEYLKQERWIPMNVVLHELGIEEAGSDE